MLLLVSLVFFLAGSASAQPKKSKYGYFRSSAPGPSTLIIESDPSAQILESFIVVQKANSGDPVAEQELGLRYLFGRGFSADTLKAAYWIRKAADQNLVNAKYNLAILVNNGWGVEWNPFEAYRLFLVAAGEGMMEAQYIIGLLYIDNLVVPRDWNTAYSYLAKSSAAGFKPAREVLDEFAKRGIHIEKDSAGNPVIPKPQPTSKKKSKAGSDTTWAPVFIDLQRDPPTALDDSTLIREAYREANLSLRFTLNREPAEHRRVEEDTSLARIVECAEIGNPEAMTLVGRLYEKGIAVEQNQILAAEYYVRAVRYDSPRASQLLWKLMQDPDFRKQLDTRGRQDDPDALFVWAGTTALKFDQTLNDQKAFEILEKAASKRHLPAMNELGLCAYQGRWTKQDRKVATAIWESAASLGSREAKVRMAAAIMTGESENRHTDADLAVLLDAAQEGSITAQLALAFCHEQGRGVQKNKGDAARLYRICAQRGSQNAFNSLKRMYDDLRPADKEFVIEE